MRRWLGSAGDGWHCLNAEVCLGEKFSSLAAGAATSRISIASRTGFFPLILTSPNRHWRYTHRNTSLNWSRSTTFLITKRRWDSFFAITRRTRFSTCCWLSVSVGHVEHVVDAHSICVERDNTGFRIECAKGLFHADSLVVATGGLSIPKIGATSFGHDLARQFGLPLVAPRPALVPLLLGGKDAAWMQLAGVSTLVRASTPGTKTSFVEKLLVTHRGLSGPAILQISSYWKAGQPVEIDFVPGSEVLGPVLSGRRDAGTLLKSLREHLPQRLAEHMANVAAPRGWTNAALEACEQKLHRFQLYPTGTEGYEKAEVTAGGVDTAGLQARTMEARDVSGAVLHWRSGGCNRPSGRVQLSVGLGIGGGGWQGCLASRASPVALLLRLDGLLLRLLRFGWRSRVGMFGWRQLESLTDHGEALVCPFDLKEFVRWAGE